MGRMSSLSGQQKRRSATSAGPRHRYEVMAGDSKVFTKTMTARTRKEAKRDR